MQLQRLYVICPTSRADALEAACDAQIAAGWLRLARDGWLRSGAPVSVASLQATDAQAAQLALIVATTVGASLVRGPDDDGPRGPDQLVDLGDALPAVAANARYTWARCQANHNLAALPPLHP